MASQLHTASDVVPQQEGVSLESDADHREQKLTRKSKQVLIVQSFCVVCLYRFSHKQISDAFHQFIISLDMTILTTTLPVCVENFGYRGQITKAIFRQLLKLSKRQQHSPIG